MRHITLLLAIVLIGAGCASNSIEASDSDSTTTVDDANPAPTSSEDSTTTITSTADSEVKQASPLGAQKALEVLPTEDELAEITGIDDSPNYEIFETGEDPLCGDSSAVFPGATARLYTDGPNRIGVEIDVSVPGFGDKWFERHLLETCPPSLSQRTDLEPPQIVGARNVSARKIETLSSDGGTFTDVVHMANVDNTLVRVRVDGRGNGLDELEMWANELLALTFEQISQTSITSAKDAARVIPTEAQLTEVTGATAWGRIPAWFTEEDFSIRPDTHCDRLAHEHPISVEVEHSYFDDTKGIDSEIQIEIGTHGEGAEWADRYRSCVDEYVESSGSAEFAEFAESVEVELPEIDGVEIVLALEGDHNYSDHVLAVVAVIGGEFVWLQLEHEDSVQELIPWSVAVLKLIASKMST